MPWRSSCVTPKVVASGKVVVEVVKNPHVGKIVYEQQKSNAYPVNHVDFEVERGEYRAGYMVL